MILTELRYLIGAKIVDLKCTVFGGNALQRSGSRLEPDPEPHREFGPVANTRGGNNAHVVQIVEEVWRGREKC